MLVLSRKEGEVVRIGRDIYLRICEIERGKVRIGIVAPREVPVYRAELIEGERHEPGDNLPVRGDVRDPRQPGVRDGGAAEEGVPEVRSEGMDPGEGV